MAVSDSIKSQFIEFIKLQGFDDKFIDRVEEKRILEVGVKNGISVEESLAILKEVAEEKGLVVERNAEEQTSAFLQNALDNDGLINKKEFEEAVSLFRSATKGKIRDPDIKQRLKQMMLDKEWKPKEGLFSGGSWFSNL